MSQPSKLIPGPRRKPGPKPLVASLAPETIFAIRYAYLVDPEATISKLSDKFALPTYAVAQLLTGPDYESTRATIHTTQTEAARDRLHAMTEAATSAWLASLVPASKRGDHRPAKDLLLATKVIDPDQHAPHVTIQIGVQVGEVTVELPAATAIQAPAKLGTEYLGPVPCIDLAPIPPSHPPVRTHVPPPGTAHPICTALPAGQGGTGTDE